MVGLVGGVLLVMGLVSFGRTLASAGTKKGNTAWPHVPGVITASWVETRSSTGVQVEVPNLNRIGPPRAHVPLVQYSYRVGSHDFIGTRISSASAGHSMRAVVDAVVRRYPVGAPVHVFYDPANPAQAVLEVDGSTVARDLVVGFLLAAGGAGMVAGWLLVGRFVS